MGSFSLSLYIFFSLSYVFFSLVGIVAFVQNAILCLRMWCCGEFNSDFSLDLCFSLCFVAIHTRVFYYVYKGLFNSFSVSIVI